MMKMNNWAKLDREALNGIIEYLDYAEKYFQTVQPKWMLMRLEICSRLIRI